MFNIQQHDIQVFLSTYLFLKHEIPKASKRTHYLSLNVCVFHFETKVPSLACDIVSVKSILLERTYQVDTYVVKSRTKCDPLEWMSSR